MIRESIYILRRDNYILIIQLVDVLFRTVTLIPGVKLLYLFVHIN